MSSSLSPGTLVVCVGLGIVLLGAALWALERFGLRLGELPLDFRLKGERGELRFPLGSSILLSIVLTVAANWFLRR